MQKENTQKMSFPVDRCFTGNPAYNCVAMDVQCQKECINGGFEKPV